MTGTLLHLAVALDGYGWHPQAWRTTLVSDSGTPSVLSGRYWAALAATAAWMLVRQPRRGDRQLRPV